MCTHIEDCMHSIETQRINVIVLEPMKGVFKEEIPHIVTVWAIEVYRPSPGCSVPVCEVWPEVGKIVALRAEVIVHDIENHTDAESVAPVDESFQPGRAA